MAPDRKLLVVLVSFGVLATARASASIEAFNTANQMLVPLNDSLTANNGEKLGRIDLLTDKAYLAFDGAVNYVIASVAPEAVKQGPVYSIGKLPNPLTTLKNAESSCKEFVLITIDGIIACKNNKGKYAAASFSHDFIQQLKANGTSIDDYINEHEEQFKASFNVTSDNSDPDGKAADVPAKKDNEFRVLQIKPGSNVTIGIGEGVAKITVTYVPVEGDSEQDIEDLQKKLCEVIDGCVYKKKESIIPEERVAKLPGMDQFTLKISINASKILGGKEAIFEIASLDKKGNTLLKVYYQLDFTAQGKGWTDYSQWYSVTRWIPYVSYFPKYRSFYYTSSCFVGPGPASMANIFGYFDRRSHWASYTYGRNLYGSGFYGNIAPYDPVAPTFITNSVTIPRWIWYINYIIDGSCSGWSAVSKIANTLSYLKARTHSNAKMEYFYESSYTANGRSVLMNRIQRGYPVMILRDLTNNNWQPGNVIGYKYYYRYNRYCYYVTVNGQSVATCGSWIPEYYYQMYVEYDAVGAWYWMYIRHSFTPII